MPTIKLKNFKYGLDARKSNVESIAGTLTELENAHINQGGEIEKRKAFVYTAFPGETFGAQATAAGIVTFGSAADPGGWAAISTAVGETVYYQRLQHLAVLFGDAYSAGSHAMTGITFSETFGLYAFAVATFADGQSFAYYNGTPIYDFTNGLVLAHLSTNVKLATDLAAILDRSGVFDGAQLAPANDHKVNMTGPVGDSYVATVSDNSAGTLAVTKSSDPTPATEAIRAIGSFEVTAGSYIAGTNKVTNVEVGPSGGAFTSIVQATDTNWTNSNEFTAALLAADINTAAVSGYTAEANGAVVTIKAAVADGDASNNYVVRVTTAGDVCIGKVKFQIQNVDGFNITAVNVNGINILSSAVAVGDTAVAAAEVATKINDHTTAATAHGYLANAKGSVVTISKAVTRSDDAPLPTYFISDAGANGEGVYEVGTGAGNVSSLEAVLSYVQFVSTTNRVGFFPGYFYFTLLLRGGILPYQSPIWTGGAVEKISDTQFRLYGNGRGLNGSAYIVDSQSPPPHIYCTVTDSGGQTGKSNTL